MCVCVCAWRAVLACRFVWKGLCEYRGNGVWQDAGVHVACDRAHQCSALLAGMCPGHVSSPHHDPCVFTHTRMICTLILMAHGLYNFAQPGDGPIALMLAPTRELALQSHEVGLKYGQSSNIKLTCVYGGAPKNQQVCHFGAHVGYMDVCRTFAMASALAHVSICYPTAHSLINGVCARAGFRLEAWCRNSDCNSGKVD